MSKKIRYFYHDFPVIFLQNIHMKHYINLNICVYPKYLRLKSARRNLRPKSIDKFLQG